MKTGRSVIAAAVVAMVSMGAVPPQAQAEPTTVGHAFTEATAGYIGCFQTTAGSLGDCLYAFAMPDGLHLSYFGSAAPDYIEEAVDPNGSITATTVSGRPAIRVDAELPLSGEIHITAVGGAPTGGVICSFCWSPSYVIDSAGLDLDARPIRFGTTDTGTIGDTVIASRLRYGYDANSAWVGAAVSGAFAGPSLTLLYF